MAKRVVLRIQLDEGAKRALDALCAKRGMTQIAAMSRLVDWFTKQDEVIQMSVLGGLSPAAMRDLARLLLKKLAAKKEGAPNNTGGTPTPPTAS